VRYAQDEVYQEDSEQNEVDGMKKGKEIAACSRHRRAQPIVCRLCLWYCAAR